MNKILLLSGMMYIIGFSLFIKNLRIFYERPEIMASLILFIFGSVSIGYVLNEDLRHNKKVKNESKKNKE